jgi:hypothetical protein
MLLRCIGGCRLRAPLVDAGKLSYRTTFFIPNGVSQKFFSCSFPYSLPSSVPLHPPSDPLHGCMSPSPGSHCFGVDSFPQAGRGKRRGGSPLARGTNDSSSSSWRCSPAWNMPIVQRKLVGNRLETRLSGSGQNIGELGGMVEFDRIPASPCRNLKFPSHQSFRRLQFTILSVSK